MFYRFFVSLLLTTPTLYGAFGPDGTGGFEATAGDSGVAPGGVYTQAASGLSVFFADGADSSITVVDSLVLNGSVGTQGTGAQARNNGRIVFNEFVTTNTGAPAGNTDGSRGIYARDGGEIFINSGAMVTTQGDNAIENNNNGLSVELGGGNALIETRGTVQIQVNGRQSRGINAAGSSTNRIVVREDANVTALGRNSRGIHANDGAQVTVEGTVSVLHQGITATSFAETPSVGIYATSSSLGEGQVFLNNANVVTTQNAVPGLLANGFFGGAPQITVDGNLSVSTTGVGSAGVTSLAGGDIRVSSGKVLTSGDASVGLATVGNNSRLVFDGGEVFGKQSALSMSPYLFFGGSNQVMEVRNTALSSETGATISLGGGSGALLLENSTVNSAASQPALQGSLGSVVDVTARESSFLGDIFADLGTDISLSALDNSFLSSQILNIDLSIDNSSEWEITGNSQLNLFSHQGVARFVFDNAFQTVTVSEDFIGGGSIHINTLLGSDGSPSDKLVLERGTAFGTTELFVTNQGGAGAITEGDGILVVEALDGAITAPDNFVLGNRVAAGPYEYFLFQGNIDASDPFSWFLRNTGELRPETIIYAALPSLLLQSGKNVLGTFHRRVGAIEPGECQTPAKKQLWIRGEVENFTFDRDNLLARQLFAEGGCDLYSRCFQGNYLFSAGVWWNAGNTTVSGALNSKYALFQSGIGGHLTLLSRQDSYADLRVSYNTICANAESEAFAIADTTFGSLSTALEFGAYLLRSDHSGIQLEAQITYQTLSSERTQDAASELLFESEGLLSTRLGARATFENRWAIFWVTPSFAWDLLGASKTTFLGAEPFVARHQYCGPYIQAEFGGTVEVRRNIFLYGSFTPQVYVNGLGHGVSGSLGLRGAF